MLDQQLRAVLHGLGIDEPTSRALLLLPLVQVAWADGAIQDKERTLIRQVAHDRGILTEEGERLVDTWLRHPPSERYLARGRMALVELAHRGGASGLPVGTGPAPLAEFAEDDVFDITAFDITAFDITAFDITAFDITDVNGTPPPVGERWYVVDCGTVNGTFVNGERVLERRLFGGEEVMVGQTRFRFSLG